MLQSANPWCSAKRSRGILGIVFLAAVPACGDAVARADQVVRRDSSGVQIVETLAPAWDSESAWEVGAEPELMIGIVEGQAQYLFGSIVGVVGMGEAGIAVADAQTNSIRIFDWAGEFLRAFGRAGAGPGEFSQLSAIRECETGRVYAEDRRSRRMSVWTVDGVLEREFTLLEPGTERGPYRTDCAASGEFLVAGWGDQSLEKAAESPVFPQMAGVWLLDREGQPLLSLGEHMVSERVAILNAQRTGGSIGPHPFGRALAFALDSADMYLGGDRVEITAYDRAGNASRIYRGPAETSLSPEEILELYAAAEVTPFVRGMVEVLQSLDTPLTGGLPAYTEIKLDSEGHLWVKRFQFPWETSARWGVFAASGEFLGHVVMPESFILHGIEAGRLLGVQRDDLGVERVAVYPLNRS